MYSFQIRPCVTISVNSDDALFLISLHGIYRQVLIFLSSGKHSESATL